jgi:hypothetical protein
VLNFLQLTRGAQPRLAVSPDLFRNLPLTTPTKFKSREQIENLFQ